jgi:type I restriction enzyme, S subunit
MMETKLPINWEKVKLSTVCDLQNGYAFKSVDYVNQSNTLSCRMSNIRPEGKFDISYNPRYLPDSFAKKYSNFLLNDGDVIIAMTDLASEPKILGVPTVVETNGKSLLLNQRVGKLIIKNTDRVYFPYLQRVLNQKDIRAYYKKFAGGGLQINLGKPDLLSNEIPLPPLEEQKRIAIILDKADIIRHKRQKAIGLIENLIQSSFVSMVGSSAKTYKEWPKMNFEELCSSNKKSLRTGPFGSDLKHSEFVDQGIAVLGIDNAVKNQFAWGQLRFITEEKYEKLKRYKVYPQDVIITIMGTTGRSAVVPKDIPESISTKHLAVLTINNEIADPEFISNSIHRHPEILKQIQKANKGAIMPGLNLGIIKSLELRIPPIKLQKQFSAILEKTRSTQEKYRKLNNALFNSLSQKAFRGER